MNQNNSILKCLICSESIYSRPSGKNYILMEKYGLEEITHQICYQCFLSMMKRCLCIKGEFGKYRIDLEKKIMVCYYCDEINSKLEHFSNQVKKRQNIF
jgi:hypothetical protein